jgi:hypothetical protein
LAGIKLELAGIKHFSGIVDPEGATATPASLTVPRWSLRLNRLAGRVEYIPPFMMYLGEILHGPAAADGAAPAAAGPGRGSDNRLRRPGYLQVTAGDVH